VNIIFDFGRRAGWLANAGVLCLLLVLVASSGCNKSDSTPASVAPSQESNSTPTAAAPTATPTPVPASLPTQSSSTNSGPTQLQLLNRALVGWEIKNHRHPRTFEEFASTANFQIPAPPAGQKYAFSQKGFIVLVNATQ
jgi:hypothetical protein